MATKRMFSLQIVDTDAFLDMPLSTQALYFHLVMRADDEGFLGNPKKIMKLIGCQEDELKVLIAKRFILSFESGIVVIKHWLIHNTIRLDRFNKTNYQKEKKQLTIKENKSYTEVATEWQPDGNHLEPQVNISKVNISKVNLIKDKETTADAEGVKTIMDLFYTINPTLNFGNTTYRKSAEDLIKQFGEEKAIGYTKAAVACYGKNYAPTITDPYLLKNKLAQLSAFYQRHKEEATPII